MNSEDTIYPRVLFRRCRAAYPEHSAYMDQAELDIVGVEATAQDWRRQYLDPIGPQLGRPSSLHTRCAMFSVVVAFRSVDLTEGLSRELEADAIFSCGSLARSQLELLGLSALAAQKLPEMFSDAVELDDFTMRLLFASRRFSDLGFPKHFTTNELIKAGAERAGAILHDDYSLVTEVAHPNNLLGWLFDADSDAIRFERRPIDSAFAELLLKICAHGLRMIARNTILLIDWAEENNLSFEDPMEGDTG